MNLTNEKVWGRNLAPTLHFLFVYKKVSKKMEKKVKKGGVLLWKKILCWKCEEFIRPFPA